MPTLYKHNGEKVAIDRKRPFSVGELQELVGGYFELIPLGSHYLVANEEGRLYGLPFNENASKLAAQFGFPEIVGDAVFTEKRWIR